MKQSLRLPILLTVWSVVLVTSLRGNPLNGVIEAGDFEFREHENLLEITYTHFDENSPHEGVVHHLAIKSNDGPDKSPSAI